MRLAIFGDSIAAGLGVNGHGYAHLVADTLDAEVIDLSGTAMQVAVSQTLAKEASDADIVVIGHGSTEAVIRPRQDLLDLLPGKYSQAWFLDPRPFYSSSRLRRAAQRAESVCRATMKRWLLRRGGSAAWGTAEVFADDLRQLIAAMPPGAQVIVVGPPPLGEAGFPGSPASMAAFSQAACRAAEDAGAAYVNTHAVVRQWGDYFADQFHLNEDGHRRIADAVLATQAASAELPLAAHHPHP